MDNQHDFENEPTEQEEYDRFMENEGVEFIDAMRERDAEEAEAVKGWFREPIWE